MLGDRYAPARTLLLAFGEDEETGGAGARATAALLQANATELAWILDEGGPVLVVRARPRPLQRAVQAPTSPGRLVCPPAPVSLGV